MLAYLECTDKEGIPRPGEPPCLFNSQQFHFKAGEKIFMDYDIAQWFISRPRYAGRLRILDQHATIQAIIRNGRVIPIDDKTGLPLEMQVIQPSEDTNERTVVKEFGNIELGPNPITRFAEINRALMAGIPGDVTVG